MSNRSEPSGSNTTMPRTGIRLRSSDSVIKATKENVSVATNFAHIRPVHVEKVNSLLSTARRRLEGPAEPKLEYRGFYHLLIIILFFGNLRVVYKDFIRFGFLNTLKQAGFGQSDFEWAAKIACINSLFWPIALLLEKLAVPAAERARKAQKKDKAAATDDKNPIWGVIAILHYVNAATSITLCSYLTYSKVWHPLAGTIVEAYIIVSFLKLCSFFLTNRDLRRSYINNVRTPELYQKVRYPDNLTARSVAYFTLIPTLVYQPEYPTVPTIRWRVVAGFAAESVVLVMAMWLLSMQMAAPILEHCLVHFHDGDLEGMIEDFFSLLTVNIAIWLCMFLLIFQSGLNLIAEVTRFADRDFYHDWWNAGSLGSYWRDWNLPVSNYFRRHMYVPLRKRGYSQTVAQLFVFTTSAVLHELLVGVATKSFNGVAFWCMLGQVPLIMVTGPLEKMRGPGTTIGNCIFWICIFLGQPTGVIIYYLGWKLRNST